MIKYFILNMKGLDKTHDISFQRNLNQALWMNQFVVTAKIVSQI